MQGLQKHSPNKYFKKVKNIAKWKLFVRRTLAAKQGVASSDPIIQILEYAFNVLRVDEVLSFTSLSNSRSMAVMQRLGMTRNENEDFNHPNLDSNDSLCRHALFRMSDQLWASEKRKFEAR